MSISEKKYEFTGETMEFDGQTLRRIRYLRQVGFMMKGSIGGWIESEDNLSHDGKCRVLDNAKVFGSARVMDDSIITDDAIVKDNAQIKEEAMIFDEAIVGADTIVSGEAHIYEKSVVFFYADKNYGQPNIKGDSAIWGKTIIEATGYICESKIKDISLFGHLNIDKDKQIIN